MLSSARSANRRSLLQMAVAAILFPSRTTAASPQDMHLQIADTVRQLTKRESVVLRLLLPNGSEGNLQPVIKSFEQMTGVKINVHQTDVDSVNADLLLDTLSKSGNFDVALPATFGVPDLASVQAILPLNHYSETYQPPGFHDEILFNTGDWFDDKLYGFQTDGDAYLMFYHKGLLENPDEAARYADQFGHPLRRPNTWEELDRQMSFFHRPDDRQFGGLLFRTPGYVGWEWWVRFHAKGVWPFAKDMTPQIDQEAGVSALEAMIHSTAYLCPQASHLGLFGNWERYGSGEIYCNIGWGGTQKYLNAPGSKMRGNMIYGPTPGGLVNGKLLVTPYFNWGWNYVVSSGSRIPEIAYLFTLFASTPEMSTLAVRQKDGYFDPFRAEHYDDPGIKDAYSSDFLEVHRASMQQAIPDLYLKDKGEYFRILNAWILRAIKGEVTAEHALKRVAQRWRVITHRAGHEAQQARWLKLRAKYPPAIRLHMRDIVRS